MDWIQALILGLIQGLTEYLPVSSSGHLAIGQAFFGMSNGEDNLIFIVAVHVATVLSTLVVLWREIAWIFKGVLPGSGSAAGNGAYWQRSEVKYALNIVVSMIPVGIVGVFFKDYVEEIFGSGLFVVGCCLLLTATLLIFAYYARPRQKEHISLRDAFIIGLAQAAAVLPGLSQFSFLMVIPPILGEALLDVLKAVKGEAVIGSVGMLPLCVGFLAAFVSGCFACKWMIDIVKRGKLVYFGVYCAVVGAILIATTL